MLNLDNACDIYKERKEMELCGVTGWRKSLKIAESNYEQTMGNCYDPPKTPNKFDEIRTILKENDL